MKEWKWRGRAEEKKEADESHLPCPVAAKAEGPPSVSARRKQLSVAAFHAAALALALLLFGRGAPTPAQPIGHFGGLRARLAGLQAAALREQLRLRPQQRTLHGGNCSLLLLGAVGRRGVKRSRARRFKTDRRRHWMSSGLRLFELRGRIWFLSLPLVSWSLFSSDVQLYLCWAYGLLR